MFHFLSQRLIRAREHHEGGGFEVSPLLLSVGILVIYTAFQLSFAWSFIAQTDEYLMHPFWQPYANSLFTPFFLVVLGLLFLWLWALIFAWLSYRRGLMWWGRMMFTGLVVVALTFWSFGMRDFWRAMAYERCEISAKEWFDAKHYKMSHHVWPGKFRGETRDPRDRRCSS